MRAVLRVTLPRPRPPRAGPTWAMREAQLSAVPRRLLPACIYSATHQYTWQDNLFTVIGFFGLAVPNFLFALVLLVGGFTLFGRAPPGLFSPEFQDASWSVARVIDMLKHIWIPVLVIGTAGTAGLIRVMRGNLWPRFRTDR